MVRMWRDEIALLTQLFALGYRILEIPSSDRGIGAFKRNGRHMTYPIATVMRLVAPARSWLAHEMNATRIVKVRTKRASRRAEP